jgi:hypothetical protein
MDDFNQALAEIAEKIIERLPGGGFEPKSPYMSAASLGHELLQKLKNDKKVIEFSAKPSGRAVLSQEQQIELSALGTKHQVVAYLVNVFEEIFVDDDLAVVNSEEYTWLRTADNSQFDRKPDVIFCFRSFYTPQKPWNCPDKKVNKLRRENSNCKFGVLSDWELRDYLGGIG